jgi:tripartite-type tricarboxylate transporter receptor subunit TctC
MIRTILAASGLTFALATPSLAQTWPDRPITFIVSQAAGSSPDVMARLLAGKLEPILGRPVIVEDKPGGGNVIGASAAASAAPDGYTFFFGTSAALTYNKFLVKKLPYDVARDFAPVALITRSYQLMVVNKNVPAKTLQEFIALDKANPGKYSIAVDGPRNLTGVTAAAMNELAGTKFLLVPYPNINNGIQDVIAGRVEGGVFSISVIDPQVREGAVRALGTTSIKRMDGAPDTPAAAEAIPGFDFSGWFMLVAPKATPAAIIEKMNAAVDKAMHDPQVREMAPKLGYEIDPKSVGTPADAAGFLKGQLDYWDKITKRLGIEPE